MSPPLPTPGHCPTRLLSSAPPSGDGVALTAAGPARSTRNPVCLAYPLSLLRTQLKCHHLQEAFADSFTYTRVPGDCLSWHLVIFLTDLVVTAIICSPACVRDSGGVLHA